MHYGVGVLQTLKVFPHKKNRKAINLSALRLRFLLLIYCTASMHENPDFVKCFLTMFFESAGAGLFQGSAFNATAEGPTVPPPKL